MIVDCGFVISDLGMWNVECGLRIGDFFCSLICVSSILRRSGRCAAEILIFFWGGSKSKRDRRGCL